MNQDMESSIKSIYERCNLKITNWQVESEAKEYDAARYSLNELKIISRTSKITPKKIGQFVTCWKRNTDGITEPFNEHDDFDFLVITAKFQNRVGQFIFPKSALSFHGVISTDRKDGKRGFRIYPKWDLPTSKQAMKSQTWQLKYFVEFTDQLDCKALSQFYYQK